MLVALRAAFLLIDAHASVPQWDASLPKRLNLGRGQSFATDWGTLPMVCVPLWVASPADRPARTPRCVKSALEQGARQNCQELASSVPGPLQFVDVGGAARRLPSD